MEVICSVQNYDWGKKGNESAVAQLAAGNKNEVIDNKKCYSELWMGVHPNGPSILKDTKENLRDFITNDTSVLGSSVNIFGEELPYLFKVLSVGKALSIQAHPAKKHAEILHEKFPNIYKDANHKPEIAIALTNFEALCGFKPIEEIKKSIETVKSLQDVLGGKLVDDFLKESDSIKPCFEALMKADPILVKNSIAKYLLTDDGSVERKLIGRLNSQYPGDVGVLCVFWLNYVVLEPGQALFLAANEPHAYIHGDCVECMSNSDNVVRAGLTPKLRDVETLCNMLTYKSYHPTDIIFQPEKEDKHTIVFRPPLKDFAVARIQIGANESYSIKPRDSASIIIAINGVSHAKFRQSSKDVEKGSVLFVPANENLLLTADTEQTLYQAFCNI